MAGSLPVWGITLAPTDWRFLKRPETCHCEAAFAESISRPELKRMRLLHWKAFAMTSSGTLWAAPYNKSNELVMLRSFILNVRGRSNCSGSTRSPTQKRPRQPRQLHFTALVISLFATRPAPYIHPSRFCTDDAAIRPSWV
jgi:hypothetical protein